MLPITKQCPVCGGEGKWRSDLLIRCKDAQCDFITSHYYWHAITHLLRTPRPGEQNDNDESLDLSVS